MLAQIRRSGCKLAISFLEDGKIIERRGVVTATESAAIAAEAEARDALATLGFDLGG